MGWSVWGADIWGPGRGEGLIESKGQILAGRQAYRHPGIYPEKGLVWRFLRLWAEAGRSRVLRTWRLRPPVSLRCSSGSSSGWLGGLPGEALGNLCCFLWLRAVTGPCPGLSHPRPHLPHYQPQSRPASPVSCLAQRLLPGPCPSPQVRPGF